LKVGPKSSGRCFSEIFATDQVLADNQSRYNVNPQEMSYMKKLAALRMYQVKGNESKNLISKSQIPRLVDFSMKSYDQVNSDANSDLF
jgi:hypothetical protein